MTAVVIVNPRAGGGRGESLAAPLVARLGAMGPAEMRLTGARGDATRLTRDALQAGASLVVAVGGDGTLHEVVNGFFVDDRRIESSAQIALLPAGTGGDFARTLALPRRADALLDRLTHPVARPIDVTRMTWTAADGSPRTRHGINIASMGMSADVARRTEERQATKGRLGPVAFLMEGVAAALRPQARPVRITLDDAPPFEGEIALCGVCNGHTFGGGMQLAPHARPDDGALDVVWIDAVARARLLWSLARVFEGGHVKHPWVHMTRARRVQVTPLGEDSLPVEADGEPFDVPGGITFEVLPGALQLRG